MTFLPSGAGNKPVELNMYDLLEVAELFSPEKGNPAIVVKWPKLLYKPLLDIIELFKIV